MRSQSAWEDTTPLALRGPHLGDRSPGDPGFLILPGERLEDRELPQRITSEVRDVRLGWAFESLEAAASRAEGISAGSYTGPPAVLTEPSEASTWDAVLHPPSVQEPYVLGTLAVGLGQFSKEDGSSTAHPVFRPRVQHEKWTMETFVMPIMARNSGCLLAIPDGVFPKEMFTTGNLARPEDFVGPSTRVSVPMSYEEDDGTEVSAQMEENILLTDFHKNVTDSIRGFDPVTEGPGIRRACSEGQGEGFPWWGFGSEETAGLQTEGLRQESEPFQMLSYQLDNYNHRLCTVYVGCSPRGYGGSSSSLSLKGSAKREKLLMDFSNRKGDFLLKICDMMIRKELKRLALALVTIEQVAQDGDLELPIGRPVLEVTRGKGTSCWTVSRSGWDPEGSQRMKSLWPPPLMLEQCGRELYRALRRDGERRPEQKMSAEEVLAAGVGPGLRLALTGAPKPSLGFHAKRSCLSSRRHGCGDGAGKPFPGVIEVAFAHLAEPEAMAGVRPDDENLQGHRYGLSKSRWSLLALDGQRGQQADKTKRQVKSKILQGVALIPWALQLALRWRRAAIPDSAWPVLFEKAARDFELKSLGGNDWVMEKFRWLFLDSTEKAVAGQPFRTVLLARDSRGRQARPAACDALRASLPLAWRLGQLEFHIENELAEVIDAEVRIESPDPEDQFGNLTPLNRSVGGQLMLRSSAQRNAMEMRPSTGLLSMRGTGEAQVFLTALRPGHVEIWVEQATGGVWFRAVTTSMSLERARPRLRFRAVWVDSVVLRQAGQSRGALPDKAMEYCGMGGCMELSKASPSDMQWQAKADEVREAFLHAWKGYERYAWGKDELQPVSRLGRNTFGGLGLTILDSLTTLWLMGFDEAFEKGLRFVKDDLDFDNADSDVSVFELTIRALGGLLGAHTLSGKEIFLERAQELGGRLLPAFQSPSRMPWPTVNLARGTSKTSTQPVILSEAGSLQVEFRSLTARTGDARFRRAADKAFQAVQSVGIPGILPVFLSPPGMAKVQAVASKFAFGALADSYYEYLLKQWLQRPSEKNFKELFLEVMDALPGIVRPSPSASETEQMAGFWGTPADRGDRGKPADLLDHLSCFAPGLIALGLMELPQHDLVEKGRNATWWRLAEGLTASCFELWASSATGLAPEFSKAESLFYLYRLTGDEKYRRWGSKLFQAILNHAKVPHGFSSVRDVKAVRGCAGMVVRRLKWACHVPFAVHHRPLILCFTDLYHVPYMESYLVPPAGLLSMASSASRGERRGFVLSTFLKNENTCLVQF
ncbi:unnamed protein product [Durusdinium trenchii]|uniref:alpha-1,2-Mannosidase n=1 Tax=Durusdinium trenchii TaxID=1381693 RepID=A0ABP0NMW1_9DINO